MLLMFDVFYYFWHKLDWLLSGVVCSMRWGSVSRCSATKGQKVFFSFWCTVHTVQKIGPLSQETVCLYCLIHTYPPATVLTVRMIELSSSPDKWMNEIIYPYQHFLSIIIRRSYSYIGVDYTTYYLLLNTYVRTTRPGGARRQACEYRQQYSTCTYFAARSISTT